MVPAVYPHGTDAASADSPGTRTSADMDAGNATGMGTRAAPLAGPE